MLFFVFDIFSHVVQTRVSLEVEVSDKNVTSNFRLISLHEIIRLYYDFRPSLYSYIYCHVKDIRI